MRKKRIAVAVGLAVVAAALMVTGLVWVVRVYQHYRSDMLTYESRHLNSIVNTSARGMAWMLDGYGLQLESLLGRMEFERAEESFLESGDGSVMEQLLSRPDVLQVDMDYAVGTYDAAGTFLASTGDFPGTYQAQEDFGGGCFIRQDEEGAFWFVFQRTSDRGVCYELAVPVQTVFSYHAAGAQVGQYGYLFMVDSGNFLVSYARNEQQNTVSVAELLSQNDDVEAQALMDLSQRSLTSPEDYLVYRYPWQKTQGTLKAEESIVVTYPVTLGEGTLVLGTALSFGEFDSFLNRTLGDVAWIILLELGGAVLLMVMATWLLVLNRRDALELTAVREKAELMEEINRQQQSLAHTERLQQLGVMTSGMVHEFNNMLTPIMSQSMLLLEQLGDTESPQFDSALDIYEASEKARDILKRMSHMSKKEGDLGFKILDLGALLRKTMALASMAKDPHIVQELTTPAEPVFVSGNEQLLTQAFLNLCINACQAMGTEGTLTVRATVERRSGHEYALVEVQDTGTGISETVMGSMYQPFFTTKGEQGTGLGLAICQKIIETHKGTIAAANRPEGGAVFTVRLPTVTLPDE
jgi:signal transduction histidine kinase